MWSRKWVWIALLGFAAALPARAAERAAVAELGQSVVSIHARVRAPDLLRPWKRKDPRTQTGSGVLLEGNRILTAAHVVANAVRVEVKRADSPRRYRAEVIHVAYPGDLALLQVASPDFLRGATPLTIGAIASPGDTVQVAGFPIGGGSLAITEGVVSRYDLGQYPTSREDILRGQVDAALNPGTSGGPVLRGGAVAGIASAILEKAENIGYFVPAPVIRHFVTDVADGSFDGVPRLGGQSTLLENEARRRFFGLRDDHSGALLVPQLLLDGTGVDALQRRDLVTAIDGKPIVRDGKYELSRGIRIPAEYLVQKRQVGEPLVLTVIRDGAKREVRTRARARRYVIPAQFTRRYLVFAGIVFQPLSYAYLNAYSKHLPRNLLSYKAREFSLAPPRRELVVLTSILEHEVNRGYQHSEDQVAARVNGTAVRDLEHLATLLDGAPGPWVELHTDTGDSLVFDLAEARQSFATVAEEYDIPRDRQLGDTPSTPPAP